MIINKTGVEAAYANLKRSIRSGVGLPHNVFLDSWCYYQFFDSDWMFDETFVAIAKSFLGSETSTVACVAIVSESNLEIGCPCPIYLDINTTGPEYAARLRGNGPISDLAIHRHSYGCTSDGGDWCIYADRMADAAVVALRRDDGLDKFRVPLAHLHSAPLEVVSATRPNGLFPFNNLTPHWRLTLTEQYGDSGIRGRSQP